ncbi:MAG: hypothetical protein IH897_08030 [Planctomycetes bacterium]|nr:hypothetical protein [Planctomycetota bacterium]
MMVANLSYDRRNRVARGLRQHYGWLSEPQTSGLQPVRMGIEQRRVVRVVVAIRRSALVAVQPRAVGAERDGLRDRIGHRQPSSSTIARAARWPSGAP